MAQGFEDKGFHDDFGEEEFKVIHNPYELQFVGSKSKDIGDDLEDKQHGSKPLAYLQLFRYATAFERRLVVIGVSLSAGSALCFPFFLTLYSEFKTHLVERNMEGVTSSFSPVHSWFGGGRILRNGTYNERMAALLEDSVAFGIGGFTICFVEFVLGVIAVTCMNHAAINQVSRVRTMFLRSLLRQEMAWHDTYGTANVSTRLADDLKKLQDGIGEAVAVVVFLVVSFISSAAVCLIQGWKLTLPVLAVALVIIIAQVIIAKLQGSLAVKESESYNVANGVVEEVLGAIRTVVAFVGEKKETQRYTSTLEKPNKVGIKRGIYQGFGTGTPWLIVFVLRAFTFWYGVILILGDRYLDAEEREYSPGIITLVLFGILTSALHIGIAAPQFDALNVARGAASAVFAIIERQSKINCFCKNGYRKIALVGDIEFSSVYFQYPARSKLPVLRGLDLKIVRGQTVAVVGHSGCGKTTVLQLIQRLYDPTQGKVTLDGVDVQCLNVAWLRSQIGVVSQEPVLFDATIEENIRYGAPNASDEEIHQAAVDANAHGFISRFPQGYQTMVGERGAQLSGGQKQRIAIARALVRRPAILLLDEATSALDRASEAQVQSALEAASRGRTTLVVAHRLSTVRAADRIVVLSEGRLVEQGTHDELMAAKGHYYGLVSVQASNVDDFSSTGVQNVDQASEMPLNSVLPKVPVSATGIKRTAIDQVDVYPAPLGTIVSLNSPEWPYLLVGCISAIIVGACNPAHVFLIGSMYRVLSIDDPEDVKNLSNQYCVLFVVVGILTGIGTFLQSYTFGVAGVQLTSRLRTSVFTAILRQEVGWFDEERNSVGALSARLAGDAPSVQGVTRTCFATFFQSTSMLVISIAFSLYLSWELTLVCIVSIPITLCPVILEHIIIEKHVIAENRALEGAIRLAVEAAAQLRTIAGLGAELTVLDRYQRELDQVLTATRKRTRLRGVFFGMETSLPFMCYALCFWYGSFLIVTKELPYENVMMIGDALIFGVWILGQSLANAPNYTTAKLAAGRLFSILDREPRIKEPLDCVEPVNLLGDITYSGVEFSYPSRSDAKILRGLDLIVQPGQTVALVGASGCGKSTCIQLLQRFYDPDVGQIGIGIQPLDRVPLRQLRQEMGIVSQEPVLFDRTIAENIAYGDNERSPDMTEIISVAMIANIHSFVESLPLGYNTRLGAKGTQLSGGQKQRIAIARALLRNPRLLLLDEATSALDSQSEKVVQAALEQAREGRTCIIVAHRLATIQNADLICVLDRGTLAEAGTHSELMQLGGIYRRLHQCGENP